LPVIAPFLKNIIHMNLPGLVVLKAFVLRRSLMPSQRPYLRADQLTQGSASVKASSDSASSSYMQFGPPRAEKAMYMACEARDGTHGPTHTEGKITLAPKTLSSVPFEDKGIADTFLLERRLRQSSMSRRHVPRAKLESKHEDDKSLSRHCSPAYSAIDPASYSRTFSGLQPVTNLESNHRFTCISAQRHKLESAF
jgi:hypothetical protein